MRYICEMCGYETGEEEEGWPEEQEDTGWQCPMCGGDRDLFYPDIYD